MKVNNEYSKLKKSYLFSEIAKRVKNFEKENPQANIIRLGIGDVTLPIVDAVVDSMHKAVDDMSKKETFRGYPPEHGQDFLLEKIEKFDYKIIDYNNLWRYDIVVKGGYKHENCRM